MADLSKQEKFGIAQSAGRGLQEYGQRELQYGASGKTQSYKRGGTVRKTGLARLHKGELVVPRKSVGRVKKMMKRKGGRGM